MFTRKSRKTTLTALLLLAAIFLGGAGHLWAFSVDVTRLYYADPSGTPPNNHEVDYDFSTGTVTDNTISIPDTFVHKPAIDANLTYTFGPFPDPSNALALQLNSGSATLSTATSGVAIISTNGNPPSQSSPVLQWTYTVNLQNFAGMTDSGLDYFVQIGMGVPNGGPHPELTAKWHVGAGVKLEAKIYDDSGMGNGISIWSATQVVLSGQDPATTQLALRVSRPPMTNQVIFEYSLDGGTTWVPFDSGYMIPLGQVSTSFLSFPAYFPYVNLFTQTAGGNIMDPFHAFSSHDQTGYYAHPFVDDPGQIYSGITAESTGLLNTTALEPRGNQWWLPQGTRLLIGTTLPTTFPSFHIVATKKAGGTDIQDRQITGYVEQFATLTSLGASVTAPPTFSWTWPAGAPPVQQFGAHVWDLTAGPMVMDVANLPPNQTSFVYNGQPLVAGHLYRYGISAVVNGNDSLSEAEFTYTGGGGGGGLTPYASDADTILLDHFDGTTSATISAYSETGACGSAKPAATPNSSYVTGPAGLSQALSLNPPVGQPAGSGTYLQYPGGQLLSQSNGTIELWVNLSSYGTGVTLVDQGPFYGSCNGWTFGMGVSAAGQLRAAAWVAFDMNSGSVVVPLNTWTHVAASWGSSGAKLYINGVQVGSDVNTGMPASGYGGSVLVNSGAVGHQIDELRISNIQRTSFQSSGGAGKGTHNASGTYTWTPATSTLALNWTSTEFTCDGPRIGTETKTGVTVTSTTMAWAGDNMTWTRTSGIADDVVGIWAATDTSSGNSYTATFNANGTVSVVGVVIQCGGNGGPKASADSQHWPNGYYVQLQYRDSPKTATAVSVTGPGITGAKTLTYDAGFGSWNSWTSPSTQVFFGSTVPAGLPFTYTFSITDSTGTWTAGSTVSCFQGAFATNLLPTGSVTTGTPTFSWTGIADSAAVYGVELNNGTGQRIWSSYNITGTSIVYNGPALTAGMTYSYLVSVKGGACNNGASFAQGSFTYGSGGSTISYSGSVQNNSDGTPFSGATVEMVGNSAINTTTAADGSFTLTGLPSGTEFSVKITGGTAYVPTYTRAMQSTSPIVSSGASNLYTPAELSAWVGAAGRGLIAGRVFNGANPQEGLVSGAVVGYTSSMGNTYPVKYGDVLGNLVDGATTANGKYYILNVVEGDIVTVSASQPNYSFTGSTKFIARDGAVCQGRITGNAVSGRVAIGGNVMNTATPAVGIKSATIEQVGASPLNATVSEADGSFYLTVPAATTFQLKISKPQASPALAPTYPANMSFGAANLSLGDYNLFNATKFGSGTGNWDITPGKGIIRATVKDQTGNIIGGATVTAQSSLHPATPYAVCYDDACTPSLVATDPNTGRYVVKNVDDGDTVTVTAQLSGWTFNSRVFPIHGDSVHQSRITGTQSTTTTLIQNGGFNGNLSGWTIQPSLDPWNPLQPDGTVSLHPPSSGYTGTVIYQNLNITGIADKTFNFSMVLNSLSQMSTGNTIAVYLVYVDNANNIKRYKLVSPANSSISANTTVTGAYTFPTDAQKLIRLEIARENYGDFSVDDIVLTADGVTVGTVPVITAISPLSGPYGAVVTITGQNFGTVQGKVQIRGTSQTINSWSDTSIQVAIISPTRSGHLSVMLDNVQSNSNVPNEFTITSPYYVVDATKNNIKVIKGQKAEFVLNLQFFNNYTTNQGISITTDQPSLNPFLTPLPAFNPGGVVMKIDTANLVAGTYQGNILYGEVGSAPFIRSVPFTLNVMTVQDIKFYSWVSTGGPSTKTYIDHVDVSAQGMVDGFYSMNTEVVVNDGSVMTGVPLAFTGDPNFITAYKNNYGGYDFYAEGASGQATVTAVAPDGFTKSLAFNITIPATPQVTSISISPATVTNKYTDTLAFSASGTEAIGYGSIGMLAIKEDTRDWYDSYRSVSGTFKLDLTTPPDLGTHLFTASISSATYPAPEKVVPLTIVNDPSYALIRGGVRSLDASILGHGMESFTLEFYDSLSVKQFSRAYWSSAMSTAGPNFEIGAIPPGTYKIKFVPNSPLIHSQWWPNANDIGGAQAVTFAAGAVVNNIYFFAWSVPTISFSGGVRDSSIISPVSGNPIAGAGVNVLEASSSFATTDTAGNFVLNGIPMGQTFTIHVTPPYVTPPNVTPYIPVYSGGLSSMTNIVSPWPFALLTVSEVSTWQVDGQNLWQTGKGMITSRVVNSANPGQTIAGAKISVVSAFGNTYNVTYFDGTAFGGTETAPNGLFYIYGIVPGDTVTVTASGSNWAFSTNTYTVRSDSISEQLLFGFQGGAQTISYNGAVVDKNGGPISGATVTVVGSSPLLQAITDGAGTFTLSGIAAGQPFTLLISMPGYVDTYTSNMTAMGNIVSLNRPFTLLTADQIAAWGGTPGTGVINGRITDGQNPAGTGIGGVVVTAQGITKTYAVTYFNATGTRTDKTYDNGKYYILNVDAGDTVIVTAKKNTWNFQPRTFTVHADSLSQGGLAGNRTLAGTWGHQTQGQYIGSVGPVWYAEAGRFIFTDNTVPGTGGTAQYTYTRNENASVTTGTESMTYLTPVRNADGSYTVNMTGNNPKPLRVSISEDGRVVLTDGTAEPGVRKLDVFVRIDPAKTYGNIDLSGDYFGLGYEYNASPVTPPNGNGANMAISNITTFNGAGSYTYVGQANSDGTIWTDDQHLTTRQYSISTDGAMSNQTGAFRGYLSGNDNMLLGGGGYVNGADSWVSYFFLKKGDKIYSNADLAGTWMFSGFGDHTDTTGGGRDVHSDTGVMVCDASGICNVNVKTLHTDGSVTTSGMPLRLAVNPDGSFVTPGSTVPVGAIGNGGKMMIWNRSFADPNDRTVIVAVLTASAVTSPITNTVWAGTHYDGGMYYADFVVNDPNHQLTSVTVSGPGITGSQNLTYRADVGAWWTIPQLLIGPPPLETFYSVTMADGANNTLTLQQRISGGVPSFATNLLPVGDVTGKITFSFTGIAGADGYLVDLFDANGNHVWQSPKGPATVIPYAGPPLQAGSYNYLVHSWIGNNSSVARASFHYTPPVQYPAGDLNHDKRVDLADAIIGLRVVAGLPTPNVFADADVNNDGAVGMTEALFVMQTLAGLRVTDQQAALTGVAATLSAYQSILNDKGATLTAVDLLPFFHPNYLNNGLNRGQAAQAELPIGVVTLDSFTINKVLFFDNVRKIITVEITFTGSKNETFTEAFAYDPASGQWLRYGNQKIGELSLPGIAASWHFDEGTGTAAADATGANNGTLVNAPGWVQGKSATALNFNGTDQYVNVKNGAILGSAPNFTIEAWVKWDGAITAHNQQMIYCEGSYNDIVDLFLDNGVPSFTTLGDNWYTATAVAPISVGVWHHLAAVLEVGIGGKLYVDGQLAASNPDIGAGSQSAGETDIGRFAGNGGSRYFSGIIDEVRVFNTARSAAEIISDYLQ